MGEVRFSLLGLNVKWFQLVTIKIDESNEYTNRFSVIVQRGGIELGVPCISFKDVSFSTLMTKPQLLLQLERLFLIFLKFQLERLIPQSHALFAPTQIDLDWKYNIQKLCGTSVFFIPSVPDLFSTIKGFSILFS